VVAIETAAGERHVAERFVLSAGAWSTELAGLIDEPIDVVPVRGQMLLYKFDAPPLTHVIECGARYLVPREDGHLLVGSTEELAGFEKQTTPEELAGLAAFAAELVPMLGDVQPIRSWAGLRPWARRGRPWVGPARGVDNVWIAAGHFRSGLQFSPSTAREIRRQMLND
jgi:glycine oxidase